MSWLTDGIAAVQSMKSTKTYGEWIGNLIRLITPPEDEECLLVGMVNYTYQELSTKKKKIRGQRGDCYIKTVTEGFEQHMLAAMKRNKFLRNAKNKKELINIIVNL